ncbi:hypothetical protein [Bradyrhizobium sp. NP1]|uniref:hypothetical protein n=1 Tax=Bradyrhizobium sp. NP1 TaxID=3049772 RepID=UPI0025A5B032|nr:hypothetical protein [Bradyrhizobium sp. NP1]WJR80822.1 hypothetical protein QOU61_14020 [Bradyrhizobium sp. NP1]
MATISASLCRMRDGAWRSSELIRCMTDFSSVAGARAADNTMICNEKWPLAGRLSSGVEK